MVGTSRNPELAEQIADELNFMPAVMDVTKVSSVKAGIERVASEFGYLDRLASQKLIRLL